MEQFTFSPTVDIIPMSVNSDYKSIVTNFINKVLMDEISASILYKRVAESLVGSGHDAMKEEFEEHSEEEFQHFNEIISFASSRGIMNEIYVTLDDSIVQYSITDIQQTVLFTQTLELQAMEDYKYIMDVSHDNGDIDTCEFFKEIRNDEVSHFDDIAQFTGQVREF